MLLPEIKEREYRFKLALRMGLPIFALILAFISSTFISTYESLQPSFYIISLLLLVVSIYFIFFLIYKGFAEKITDTVTKTFSREYLYKYLQVKIKKDYTLMLLSVGNLNDINTRYGIQNGDKVLYETIQYISKYLEEKNIRNFPVGHIKGGDFIIGLDGNKNNHTTILDLLCLKSTEFKVDDIEVDIYGSISDSSYSKDLNHLIEHLFVLQEINKNKKTLLHDNTIDPNTLESYVIKAISNEKIEITVQDIYENDKITMQEYFAKLKTDDGKILHPKAYMKVLNTLGLTTQYDFLVLQKSILKFKEANLKAFSITINPTSLRNHNFLTQVKELLRDNKELKSKITFIISEKEYYSHSARFNTTLQKLRQDGVKICLDKLGSLHTTFLYMRDLEIDIVRFDSIYTKDTVNEKYKNIVDGFHTMAESKGIKTWLKMVNTKEDKAFSKDIGITYIQGKELAELN